MLGGSSVACAVFQSVEALDVTGAVSQSTANAWRNTWRNTTSS